MIPAVNRTDRSVALHLENVRRSFGDVTVIDNLTLDVAPGEFLAILGPSGCGKSTLLRVIAGLTPINSGTLRLDPARQKLQTAFVFQDAHLLPWLTVLENAALPLELVGVERRDRLQRASRALAAVGLGDVESRYPSQLSGGMRMRVSVARALVTEPRLLLLDEPFAALDEITRFRLEVLLRSLWKEREMTVILVTHSITEAAFLANRAVVLSRRGCHISLDRRLALPDQREDQVRLTAPFAEEMKHLMSAISEQD